MRETVGEHSIPATAARLMALAALALSQPLFDLLARAPEFLALRLGSLSELVGWLLVLALGPAAVAVGSYLAARLWGRPLARIVEWFWVAVFLALVSCRWLKVLLGEQEASVGWPMLVAAAGMTVTALWVYQRSVHARAILGVASIGLLAFPLLFLASVGGRSLVRGLTAAGTPAGESQARVEEGLPPVLFMVFDELGSRRLFGADGQIDAELFPHFAALTERSLWFPRTAAASDATVAAMPALLSGRLPRQGALPLLSDHPDNLFTLLAPRYEIWSREVSTRLCPPSINRRTESRELPGALAVDLAWVYLHLVAPSPWSERLPSVDQTWGNFGRQSASGVGASTSSAGLQEAEALAVEANRSDRTAQFRDLVQVAGALRTGELSFAHVMLPHVPWVYSAAGRTYDAGRGRVPGLGVKAWQVDQPVLVAAAEERYVAQVRWLDQLVGELIEHLEETGVFDRALIVITADHGTAFVPGAPRRELTAANASDLVPVPLWIKLPQQSEGETRTELAMAVDVLPTVLEVLDVDGPALPVGRSLLEPYERTRVEVRPLAGDSESFGPELFVSAQRPPAHRFSGSRVGSFVMSREKASIRQTTGESAADRHYELQSGSAPIWWQEVVESPTREDGTATVLLALNGVVARVFDVVRGRSRTTLAALLPEELLVPGDNHVTLYEVVVGTPPQLAPLTPRESGGDRLLLGHRGQPVGLVTGGRWLPIEAAGRTRGRLRGVELDDEPGLAAWVAAPGGAVIVTLGDKIVAQGEGLGGGDDRQQFRLSLEAVDREDARRRGLRAFFVPSDAESAWELPSTRRLDASGGLVSSDGRVFEALGTVPGSVGYSVRALTTEGQLIEGRLTEGQLPEMVLVELSEPLPLRPPVDIAVLVNGRQEAVRTLFEDLTEAALGRVRIPLSRGASSTPVRLDVLLIAADGTVMSVPRLDPLTTAAGKPARP